MTTKEIKGLLFDFDGTLLDTNELIIQTFLHVLEPEFPGKFTREDMIPFIGPSLMESFSTIDPNRAEEWVRQYRIWNDKHHDELAKEFDGVTSTLYALREKGIRLAIVSTKALESLSKGIRLLGIEDLIEVVVSMDDVKNVKPDPEPILLALKKLHLEKENVLMIGDNSHDIIGGQNAGVKTAGVAWSLKGEEFLMQFKPDYMLHHMSDLLLIVGDQENA
ncbi:pyrophosphatase PpaX [Rummeliibacillus pycnus]|uniref:pyrophosphatase PpaX n=1 Tax=Rummeliibacillus pycnus TaxID=101070 RepID=UPI000C9CE406|nr:pyrophosphatase PpaX [Rummeliibacillus pycnus]